MFTLICQTYKKSRPARPIYCCQKWSLVSGVWHIAPDRTQGKDREPISASWQGCSEISVWPCWKVKDCNKEDVRVLILMLARVKNGDVGSGMNNWEGTQRGSETRWRRGLEIGELFACWVVRLWVWAECWGLIDWLKIVGLAKCAKIPTHFNHPICYKMCLKYKCGKLDI